MAYWGNQGKHQSKYDALCAKYPANVKAVPPHIEVLRVVGGFYYDAYNNGGFSFASNQRTDELLAVLRRVKPDCATFKKCMADAKLALHSANVRNSLLEILESKPDDELLEIAAAARAMSEDISKKYLLSDSYLDALVDATVAWASAVENEW